METIHGSPKYNYDKCNYMYNLFKLTEHNMNKISHDYTLFLSFNLNAACPSFIRKTQLYL